LFIKPIHQPWAFNQYTEVLKRNKKAKVYIKSRNKSIGAYNRTLKSIQHKYKTVDKNANAENSRSREFEFLVMHVKITVSLVNTC